MTRLRELGLTAALVVALLWSLDVLLRPRHDVRNFDFLPDMVTSRARETFAASHLLSGGTVQQPLVTGVVPRDATPFPFAGGPEEAARAGATLDNPFADAGPEDLERGRRLYATYCAPCHDSAGEGRGPVVMRGMVPPPSLLADRARTLPDGTLFHVLTRGQGNMRSYEAQLSAEDRWRIVGWVRELQGGER